MGESHTLIFIEWSLKMEQIENEKKIISKKEFWRKQRLEKKEKYKKKCRGSIRLTENEKAYLINKATSCGYDFTTYILENSLYAEMNVVNIDFLKEHTAAINKLGNNVNQITRQINVAVNSKSLNEKEVEEFRDTLLAYTNLIKELYSLNQKIYIRLQQSLTKKKSGYYDEDSNYIDREN